MPDTKLPLDELELAEKLAKTFGYFDGDEGGATAADYDASGISESNGKYDFDFRLSLELGEFACLRNSQYNLELHPVYNDTFTDLEFHVEIDTESDTVVCTRTADASAGYEGGGQSSGMDVYLGKTLIFEDGDFTEEMPVSQCMEAVGMDTASQIEEYKTLTEEYGEVFDPDDCDFISEMTDRLTDHIAELPMELHQYHPDATETFKLSELQ